MNDEIDPSAVVWSAASPGGAPGDLLVLLHGYGSNERELFAQVAPLVPEMLVASVRGPVAEESGFGWVSLQRSIRTLVPVELFALADRVAGSVLKWLDGLPTGRIGLLGVSQGGVLALHLLRAAPQRFTFAVSLSGYVLDGAAAGDEQLRARRPPVFWGRGRYDDLIPAEAIERTSIWLPQHSTPTEGVYDMGHTVSDEELRDAAAFIETATTARPG